MGRFFLRCVFLLYFSTVYAINISDEVKSDDSKTKDRGGQEEVKAESIGSHPAWQYLLHDEVVCGESFADRIIGGKDAPLGQYPWIARLGYASKFKKGEAEYKCGGSLINTIYVLSAAHCVKPETPIKVRLGEHDLTTEIDCVGDMCAEAPQDFSIKEITIHDQYNNPKLTKDLVLIRLNKEAIYNGWVGHVCLPQPSVMLTMTGMAETAGWGITSMDTLDTATILQMLKIPLVPLEECANFYKPLMTLTEEQLCAGGKIDHDACGGDSGGPLMKVVMGEEIPQYFLIGVVSFGPTMCGGEPPGVFANTTYHLKWILDHIKPVEESDKI